MAKKQQAVSQASQASQASRELPGGRILSHTKTIFSDLFELKATAAKKLLPLSDPEDPASYWPVQHQHFYHTVDSSGKRQFRCAPFGGHFHEIKVIPPKEEGGIPTIEVSGPLKEIVRVTRSRETGRQTRKKMIVPVNAFDNHTHEAVYVRSSEVQQRKANLEAAKVQSAEAAKTQPIPGILS